MSYFKNLTFLKVLTAIAWADGDLAESELNILKAFYRKFNLDRNELDELKPYLGAPVSKKIRDELFQQLVAELSSPREKQEILSALESMAHAKGKKSAEEKELLDQFTHILENSSLTKRSFGKIRNLLGRTIFQHARDRDPDLEKYFKRKVFHKIELHRAKTGHKINLSDEKVYYLCLLGVLLASVAHADGNFDDREKKSLRKILKEEFTFDGKELKVLLEIVEEQAKKGFDFHEVVTHVNQMLRDNEKIKLVDCFFAIAIADGEISHDENEEVRRITKAMHVPHQIFKASKMKALDKMRG
jgi:uncharacterized tellurite resistance protein B-like protein